MMIFYTSIGVFNYNKVLPKGWHKIHSLFLVQTGVIIYLAVNELTTRNIHGIFIIYLMTQYSLFLTFCLVIDSCLTSEQKSDKNNYAIMSNKVYRGVMHVFSWGLFFYAFWMPSCYETIYPHQFITVSLIIVVHQAYDLWLSRHDYMINFKELPATSANGLRYNKELFDAQTKCLFKANLIFGILSMLTASTGYFIMNRQSDSGSKEHLMCYEGTQWVYMSHLGNLLGTMHQALILMQINITQFVLVKIPRNMEIFNKAKSTTAVTKGLQATLLRNLTMNQAAINADGGDENDDGFKKPE